MFFLDVRVFACLCSLCLALVILRGVRGQMITAVPIYGERRVLLHHRVFPSASHRVSEDTTLTNARGRGFNASTSTEQTDHQFCDHKAFPHNATSVSTICPPAVDDDDRSVQTCGSENCERAHMPHQKRAMSKVVLFVSWFAGGALFFVVI